METIRSADAARVRFFNDLISLQLVIGPGANEGIRNKLIDAAAQNPQTFNRGGAEPSDYMQLDIREDILDDQDLANWDDPSVGAKLDTWAQDFAERHLPAMNDIIINCLREYEGQRAEQ